MNGETTTSYSSRVIVLHTLSIATICAYVVWLTFWFRRWDYEDGYTLYRVVRNLFEQVGWSYNIGERLNASPSPLTTLLILVLTKIVVLYRGDPDLAIPEAGHLLSGASLLITCLCVRQLFSRSGHVVIGTACAIHLAFALATSSAWGTEVFPCCALLSLFVLCETLKKWRLSWLILGLAFITSFDTIAVVALKIAVQIWHNGLSKARSLIGHMKRLSTKQHTTQSIADDDLPKIRGAIVPFLVPVLPWFTFSIVLFDQLFPDILLAKMWQGRSGFWGPKPVYLNALVEYLSLTSTVRLAAFGIASLGLLSLLLKRNAAAYILGYVLLQQCIFIYLGIPATPAHFSWIAAVEVLGLWIVVASGLAFAANSMRTRYTAAYLCVGKIAPYVVLSVSICGLALLPRTRDTYSSEDSRQLSYRKAALFIEDDKRFPDGELSAVETGTLGFYTRRQVLDFTGLTSRNPQFVDGRHNDRFYEISPAAVVLHTPPTQLEKAVAEDPRFSFWYDKIISLEDTPIPLTLFARTKKTPSQLREYVSSATRGFDPILMVNPIASVKAQCRIDTINGEKMVGRTTYRTNSPLLNIRGWAIRKDVDLNPAEDVRIILIGDLGRAFAVYAPRHELSEGLKEGQTDIFHNAGFSIITNLYAVPRGNYGVMIWQQGVLCGPVIGLLYE